MELRQLETFRTAAQTLSFSQTATKLNYAQSTVSTQIQALETELGVVLFDRLNKRVVLTAAGKRLLGYADKILALQGEAQIVVSDAETLSGSLVINAPETLCTYRLPAIWRQYRQQYPHVQITFSPDYESTLLDALREGLMDVAFVMTEPFTSPYLVVEPLCSEQMLLVAYPNHPLLETQRVTFADLRDEPLLLTESTCNYRRAFESAMLSAGVHPSIPIMEFYSVEAIKQCVMAGIGITFLPQMAVEKEIAQGQLWPLSWGGQDFKIVTHVVYHKDKWLSPALCHFLEMVRAMRIPA